MFAVLASDPARACCPAPRSGKAVVNADQTVILIWDAATKTQHFIRKASFKSEADDFGFLVPSPSKPELNESGNEAFGVLAKLTEPETKTVKRPAGGGGCNCALSDSGSRDKANREPPSVVVLEQKLVAGFQASVLETKSTAALVAWLKENGYAFSPAVEAWAKPYVENGWKITALKVAKKADAKATKDVAASALRMTFQTDRPLFPYREPASGESATKLGVDQRLLRIFFIADARYQGELTKDTPWTGKVAWAGKVEESNRKKLLDLLKLPEATGPAAWWLTEFEDRWPYRVAPADVYFSRDAEQSEIRREPIIQYVSSRWPADVMAYALAAVVVFPPLCRRVRRERARG